MEYDAGYDGYVFPEVEKNTQLEDLAGALFFPFRAGVTEFQANSIPIPENQSHMFGPFNCHFVWFLLGACGFVLASNGALFETKLVV